MKKCSKCEQWKDIVEFHKSKGKKGGFNGYCKECAGTVAKEWYKENKHREDVKERLVRYETKVDVLGKIVDEIKSTYGCAICGENEPCSLDFHHPDANKDKEVSILKGEKNVERLCKEINKCVIVCSNCHRKIHKKILLCPDIKVVVDLEGFVRKVVENESLFIERRLRTREFPGCVVKRSIPLSPQKRTNCVSCGKSILARSITCKECAAKLNGIKQRKVERPSKEELQKMLWEKPTTEIAKEFGVSDSAVSKWAKAYELKKPNRGYWAKKKVGLI